MTLHQIENLCVEEDLLELVSLKNAMVYPCMKHPELSRRFMGGVNDSNSLICQHSLLNRGSGPIVHAAITDNYQVNDVAGISGSSIFGGYIFDHFGHFMLESLSRVWALQENPTNPIIWCPVGKRNEFTGWQSQILDLLGLMDREHVFCREPRLAENIFVPQPGYRIQNYFHRKQANALARVQASKRVKGKKLWLSRSKQEARRGGWDNELEIECELEKAGWIIFCPEEYSVIDQISEISSSERIAGSEGSGFHTVVLCKNLQTRMDIFSRAEKFSLNYKTIASTRGLIQYLHLPELQRLSVKGAGSRFHVIDPESVVLSLTVDNPSLPINVPTKISIQ